METTRQQAGLAVLGLLLSTLAWPPAATRAQLPERARSALDEAAVDRIERSVRRAEAHGVPARPLVARALEGVAKGVPGEAVSRSVSAYADRLVRSAALLGDQAAPGLHVAAADALRNGVEPAAVRRMARRAGERAPAALVALTDLRKLGLPVERALEVVSDALEANRPGEALLSLPRQVARDLEGGRRPSQSADAASGSRAPAGLDVGHGVWIPSGPPVPPGSVPPSSSQLGSPAGGAS